MPEKINENNEDEVILVEELEDLDEGKKKVQKEEDDESDGEEETDDPDDSDDEDEDESKDESVDADEDSTIEEDMEDAYIESVLEELPESKLGMVQSFYEIMSDLTEDELKARSKFIVESLSMDTSRLTNRNFDFDMIDSTLDEDVETILGEDDDLDEETKLRARTIFEAAVLRRVDKLRQSVESNYKEDMETRLTEYKEKLSEATDRLLNDAINDWVQENELAIVSGVKSEITENFIMEMRNVFKENYIELPDNKENLVETLQSKVDELEQLAGDEVDLKSTLQEENEALRIKLIFQEACEGLTENEKESFQELAEHLKYTGDEEYTSGLKLIKESVYSNSSDDDSEYHLIDEDVDFGLVDTEGVEDDDDGEIETSEPIVRAVVDQLSK